MKALFKTVSLNLLGLFLTSNAFAFSVSYDQTVKVETNVVATIKVVVQDDKMWAESKFSGIETVVLRNETGAYSYVPAQKMATKIPASMDRPNLTRDLPRFMEFLTNNSGTKVSSETIDGKNCDVYNFIEPTLKKEAKAWVWTEKNFPLKIEVPAPEGLTIVELTNIHFDPVITPGQFQLPEDVRVVDLEAAEPAQMPADAEAQATGPEEAAPKQL